MRRPLALLTALALAACASDPATDAGASPSPSPPVLDGCPQRYDAGAGEPWVPAPPTTETPGRLVPDADPVEALVCRYGDVAAEQAELEGEVVLEGGLDRIRTDLLVPAEVDGAERACTATGGGVVPHLLRLRYADGELWLSAVQEPDGCSGTGNGAYTSSAYLGDRLAQAYDSGTWPAPLSG